MAGIHRHFLGWNETPMASAARYVLGLAGGGRGGAGAGAGAGVLSLVDLSRVVVVVPGRRAARMLHAEMLDRVRGTGGMGLAPPRIVTPGQATGVVARGVLGAGAGAGAGAGGGRGPAGEVGVAAPMLVRRLAWVAALAETPREQVRAFVARVDEFAGDADGDSAAGDGGEVIAGAADDGAFGGGDAWAGEFGEPGSAARGAEEIGGKAEGRAVDAEAQPWPLSGVATMLMRASEELAGEMLRFADVALRVDGGSGGEGTRGAGVGGGVIGDRSAEGARWRAMSAVQERYERVLGVMGYVDEGMAVMDALAGGGAGRAAGQVGAGARAAGGDGGIAAVVVVGVADPSAAMRRAMIVAGDAGVDVHALVMSNACNEARFDALGAVVPEMWIGGAGSPGGRVTLAMQEGDIEIAADADDQARRVMRVLEGLKGTGVAGVECAAGTDDAAVVVPDEDLVPSLVRASAGSRVRLRSAAGEPLAATGPMRVLSGLLALTRDGDYASLASFVRLSDVERWLLRVMPTGGVRDGVSEWWLREMDEHAQRTLPTALDALMDQAAGAGGGAEVWSDYERGPRDVSMLVAERVAELVGVLKAGGTGGGASGGTSSGASGGASGVGGGLAGCARAILACMSEVYSGRSLSRDRAEDAGTILALEELRDALTPMLGIADGRVRMSPAMLLSHVISVLSDVPMAGQGQAGAVEMMGWLEVSLDPAPVVVVTGVNEGVLPSGGVGDALLPNGLRRALGMSHDAVRLARDTHLMESLLRTRRRVVLMAGKRTADGDPQRPSRLLFACADDVLVRRLARWSGAAEEDRGAERGGGVTSGGVDRTRLMPTVTPTPVVERMSVTAFRDYLASPYAYYIRHVLRLQEAGVPPTELDALAFGSLVHTVLDRFGRGGAAGSTSEHEVRGALLDELATLVQQRLGRRRSPAVRLQIGTAAERLSAFARVQARRARDGWRIAHCEWSPAAQLAERAARRAGAGDARAAGAGAALVHPTMTAEDQTMILTGKVDRIDIHADGRWAIFDYKTGESQDPPEKAHRASDGSWRDLQLPLYRHLIAELNPPVEAGRLTVGYIALPRDPLEVRIHEAAWGPAEYASADEAARAVILAVRAGRFAETGERPPEDGPVAALCGIGYIGAAPSVIDEDAGGEA